MKYSIEWLLRKVNKKEKIHYLFFWGHTPSKDGSVTKSCFSQWWAASFVVDGIRYATAEHWMMAGKARLFGDEEALAQILNAGSPMQAKKLGRNVKGFNQQKWDAHCFEIVREGNYHKFSQHPEVKEFLLNTGDKVLVEASPVDAVWGIGLAGDDPRAQNPRLWKGKNLLGFALMEVRERFINEK